MKILKEQRLTNSSRQIVCSHLGDAMKYSSGIDSGSSPFNNYQRQCINLLNATNENNILTKSGL